MLLFIIKENTFVPFQILQENNCVVQNLKQQLFYLIEQFLTFLIQYKPLLVSGQSRPSVGDLTEVIVVARPEVIISISSPGQQLEETTVIESDLTNITLSCDLVLPIRHNVIRHRTRHKHARYKQGDTQQLFSSISFSWNKD